MFLRTRKIVRMSHRTRKVVIMFSTTRRGYNNVSMNKECSNNVSHRRGGWNNVSQYTGICSKAFTAKRKVPTMLLQNKVGCKDVFTGQGRF